MGRGLDGNLIAICHWRCIVLKARRGRSHRFPVVIARGKHLFPFRTEPLSPSAPMVLGPQGPGRVGRRRFFFIGPACHCHRRGRSCAPDRPERLGDVVSENPLDRESSRPPRGGHFDRVTRRSVQKSPGHWGLG